MQVINFRLRQEFIEQSIPSLQNKVAVVTEYPTAKAYIPGLVVSEEKEILLVRKGADGEWAL